jgi:hypothetical protein
MISDENMALVEAPSSIIVTQTYYEDIIIKSLKYYMKNHPCYRERVRKELENGARGESE